MDHAISFVHFGDSNVTEASLQYNEPVYQCSYMKILAGCSTLSCIRVPHPVSTVSTQSISTSSGYYFIHDPIQ